MTNADQTAVNPAKAISPDAVSSLFQAIAGLRNMRAAAAMLVCFALSVVIPGLLWMLLGKGFVGMSVGALSTIFLLASGIHSGGILLMAQAKKVEMISVPEAIGVGVWCALRSIILIIVFVLVAILVYLFMALLFYVCKLPGIGPLLYAFVFPVAVVVMGLTFTGLFIGLTISFAAMWEGATVVGALAKALAVLRARLVETVLMTSVVSVLASFVFAFVGGILMSGFMPAVGMSASILDASPQMFGSLGASLMGMDSGMRGMGEVGGYLVAGSFGGGLLFALTMTLVFQVWLLGINMMYVKVTEGIDASATESALHSGLSEARRKAAEVGTRAMQAAEKARTQTAQAVEKTRTASAEAASASVVPVAETALGETQVISRPAAGACPACSAEVSPDDRFCGSCGHRMKA